LNYTEIVAVVVSYNGEHNTENTIRALLGKVGQICVIDNGSDSLSIDILRKLELQHLITLIEVGENKGIGYALNKGLSYAIDSGFKWFLSMDQDTQVSDNMVDEYVRSCNTHPNLVCLAPTINVFGKELMFNSGNQELDAREIKYAITSGNLVKLSIIPDIGFYNEELFIDCVDFEFCLRLRDKGYKIYQIKEAVIFHQLGSEHNVPAIFAWFYTSHSPLRRYYMYRNWGYMIKMFFSKYPIFIIKSTLIHILLICVIPFYDEKPRESLRHIYLGIKDFIKNKKGAFTNC